MVILSILSSFRLPLENPVLIFSTILFIILFAPIVLNKFRIPYLIGLILAGAIIGPNGLNVLLRDSSVVLFSTVGLLYIMFLAGLEVDMNEFRKNRWRSLVFGMFTFLIPMGMGIASGQYLLGFALPTAILLASMFASHTLIAYPIIRNLGVARNKAVNIAIGGTIITDTLALLVLAVIAGMYTGSYSELFWYRISISLVIFSLIILVGFPYLGRWFFKKYDDSISQYIFVLGLVFLGAFLAEAAGIEAIIGAFFAGLALNRLIPHTSPLMNRIEFVGNALFIPFFLIGVGMLVDIRVFFKDFETIFVAIVMTVVATTSKFAAAWLTQKTFRFSADERRLIFGLSNAQAAATLAAVLVGYNIIIGTDEAGDPIRLLNDAVLNSTIIMILVTCTIASFVAQKGASNLALQESQDVEIDEEPANQKERILLPMNQLSTVEELVQLSVIVKNPRTKDNLYALTVVTSDEEAALMKKNAGKILDKAAVTASATDNRVRPLLRYDLNIVNAIENIVKEHDISDIILGVNPAKGMTSTFLSNVTEGILNKCETTTFIYRSIQPLSTIRRNIILIPEKAELEIGFPLWLAKLWNLSRNTGAQLVSYAHEDTTKYLVQVHKEHPINAVFKHFSDWDDMLVLSRDIAINDNLIIVMSRRNRPSYTPAMLKIPSYLNKYFQQNNYLIIYPFQYGISSDSSKDINNAADYESLGQNIVVFDDIAKAISRIFGKR